MSATPSVTVDELREVLQRVAGEDESIDLSGDLTGRSFEDLGYDSLAVLELSNQIEIRYGIKLLDSAVVDAVTVGDFLTLVNTTLSEGASA
ncbi:acyl carrier protein [Nocardia concava]|uniref:acyl carrier protein n=1 Tax=Nocardia concava TaxID=257281 RepID=UPI00059375CD|nr:acyl carrier protein [Nocardia concava]